MIGFSAVEAKATLISTSLPPMEAPAAGATNSTVAAWSAAEMNIKSVISAFPIPVSSKKLYHRRGRKSSERSTFPAVCGIPSVGGTTLNVQRSTGKPEASSSGETHEAGKSGTERKEARRLGNCTRYELELIALRQHVLRREAAYQSEGRQVYLRE